MPHICSACKTHGPIMARCKCGTYFVSMPEVSDKELSELGYTAVPTYRTSDDVNEVGITLSLLQMNMAKKSGDKKMAADAMANLLASIPNLE